jgi:hypothetical protein
MIQISEELESMIAEFNVLYVEYKKSVEQAANEPKDLFEEIEKSRKLFELNTRITPQVVEELHGKKVTALTLDGELCAGIINETLVLGCEGEVIGATVFCTLSNGEQGLSLWVTTGDINTTGRYPMDRLR